MMKRQMVPRPVGPDDGQPQPHGQPHGQTHTQSAHVQPHGQPHVQSHVQQPHAPSGHGQPHVQSGHGQPHPQSGHGQPHVQAGHGQPHVQSGHGQPIGQQSHGQSHVQAHGQPHGHVQPHPQAHGQSHAQPQPIPQNQGGATNMHTLAQSAQQPQILGATTMLAMGTGFVRRPSTPVINYLKPGSVAYKPPAVNIQQRHINKQPLTSPAPSPTGSPGLSLTPPGGFQRLKVEDALSYLDQVKYKFNPQPQVYNDFLDIMKEFKNQTIDTPGVITRVSNLFKGHPELIVGFNTFLPPGYKIEVQSNGQVSVSMPSPTSLGASGVGGPVVPVGPGAQVPGVVSPPAPSSVILGVHHTPQPQLLHLLPVPVPQTVSTAIVHNLSVSPANTLHHISQAHQQIEAGHHSGAQNSGNHTPTATAGQPVEFNHAIDYVNKIKSRFSKQPDKYKRFLEILHAYQRGHRDGKDAICKQQTEQEVYSQVAKLFEGQDDLLAEFGQFLPDAKATPTKHHSTHQSRSAIEGSPSPPRFPPAPLSPPHNVIPKHQTPVTSSAPPQHHHLKRSPSFSSQISSSAPPPKRPRFPAQRDVSLAEASKMATMYEYNYFDRVRHALNNQEVYDNFLRCLLLFTNEVVSSAELVQMTAPFLCRHPDLQRWLSDFVGPVSPPHTPTNTHTNNYNSYNQTNPNNLLSYDREKAVELVKNERRRYDSLGTLGAQIRHERPTGDMAMDVDLSTCRRLGTSYCRLPRQDAIRRCSGRTPLCREVLNDTWVSFPTWSEDSTFVSSRKTQYEEHMYRCEDERFELDVVIETNSAAIRALESVQKRLSRMSSEEAARFRLDDALGGTSHTIQQRALRRIYGDKVAVDIIAGLKKNPGVAVPVVLRRLKAKEEEWREAQKGFNKQWREQNEKYYLKSLDHQGINFKQNDLKALRSKSLLNEIEAAYSARKVGPHLTVDYNMKNKAEAIKILRDAAELLIHHARRQTAIQKVEKKKIKQLLRQFIPDMFNHPRQPLSDDERDDEDKDELGSPASPPDDDKETDAKTNSIKQEKQESSESDNASDKSSRNNNHNKNNKENTPKNNISADTHIKENSNINIKRSNSCEDLKPDIKTEPEMEEESCELQPNEMRWVCSASWYLFLRLHGVLCARLSAARRRALQLDASPHAGPAPRPIATAHAATTTPAAALRLQACVVPAQRYPALLDLVRALLDGNTDPCAYEDRARELLGIYAYPAYTLDRLVAAAVRQLQRCTSESWSLRAAASARHRPDPADLRRLRRLVRNHSAAYLVRAYGGNECRVTFSLLEAASEDRTSPNTTDGGRLSPNGQSRGRLVRLAAEYSMYASQLSSPLVSSPGPAPAPAPRPLYLRRNARRTGAPDVVRNALTVTHTTHAPHSTHAPHNNRRKPPRPVDTQECARNTVARMVAARAHTVYRPGGLMAGQRSLGAARAKRRERFENWIRSKQT